MIEKNILKELHSKLGLEFIEKSNYNFADYVKEARAKHQKMASG